MFAMQGLPRALLFAGLTTMVCTILVSWIIVPGIVHWQITQMFRLEPGKDVWNGWSDIKAEIFLKVYVFNVTNHEEVMHGEIPKIEELGPYVYEQKRHKEILNIDSENGTVSYRNTMLHHFRADLSNGTEEDSLIMINVPLLSVASELGTMSRWIRYVARTYLESFEEEAFVKTTVGTVLFKGSHVPMIESISELMGRTLLPNNTFALFIERNGAIPDTFEVDTGVHDSESFGRVKRWKGQSELDIWGGPSCNMINGTDSTIYAPFVTKQKVLRIFEAEICRSLYLTYEREEEAEGIPTYKFSLPEDIFSEENPDNQCFCKEQEKSNCPKSGLVSVGACKQGAPIFISNPHYLFADPSYAEPFGMKPNASLHRSHLILEPRTGVVLKGHKRIQLNTQLKPSDSVDAFAHVPTITLPLVWIDETAFQDPAEVSKIRNMLVIPLLVLEYAKWALLALSCAMTVLGTAMFAVRSSQEKQKQRKLQAREQEKFPYLL